MRIFPYLLPTHHYRFMDALFQDIRYGARMLARRPLFTLVAVLTLALGVGANTAIFSIVDAVLLRPLPYPEPDRLIMIFDNFNRMGITDLPLSAPELADYHKHAGVFETLDGYATVQTNMTGEGEPEQVRVTNVSANLLPTLGARTSRGRLFTASEDRPGNGQVVVISHGMWQRRFGSDPSVVGRTVRLSGTPFTVVGVMAPEFRFLEETEFWTPLALGPDMLELRGMRWISAIARMKPGVTIDDARKALNRTTKELGEQYPKFYSKNAQFSITVRSLMDLTVGEVRPALLVLLGAVGCVLLIACANIASLLLARALGRRREMALRAALGAGRGRLIMQMLVESLLLAVMGGVIGLLLAYWGLDILLAFSPEGLPRVDEIEINPIVLLFTLGLTLISGIIFGLVPALQVSRVHLNEALNEGGRGGMEGFGRRRLQNGLVIAEMALALVLLVGAGLALRSFAGILDVEPGFDPENLLTLSIALPEEQYTDQRPAEFFQTLSERVSRIGGVTGVGATNILPISGDGSDWTYIVEGKPPAPGEPTPSGQWRVVTPGYFRTMKIPLLKGRMLSDDDRIGGTNVMVINSTMEALHWPAGDAIGKRIKLGVDTAQPWRTIVGVVGDVRHFGLDKDVRQEMYFPSNQFPQAAMQVVVRTTGEPLDLVEAVKADARALDPDVPVANVSTMEYMVDKSVMGRKLNMGVLAAFAGLALLLATIGIYGLMSYSVAQRTREIGIRMALGASPAQVRRMVLRQGMATTLAGILIGLAGSFLLARLMESFLFGVAASDPPTYITVTLVLLIAALLACYLPARRATGVDPMVALRHE